MELKVLKFIKQHKENDEWEKNLAEKPYCISISKKDNLILLKYSQIDSDFTNEIVRECRGLIIDTDFNAVCVPFFKFGNYGESYCPEIDWQSARVQEKVDGSLIKVFYYNDKWNISTSGTIDAFDSEIYVFNGINDSDYSTFGDLFLKAKENCGLDFNILNKEYTYMFELVSPHNKVVVPYPNIEIYHIGTRDNKTLEEKICDIGIQKPKEYDLHTIEDCIATAELFPFTQEGYVVVDKYWNRIKIKSPAYVAVHYLRGNGIIRAKSLIQIIRKNEIEEFLIYCPEYEKAILEVDTILKEVIKYADDKIAELKTKNFATQKDFALEVKDLKLSHFFFKWRLDGEKINFIDFLWEQTNNKIEEIMELWNKS